MLNLETLKTSLSQAFLEATLPFDSLQRGKVRDSYILENNRRLLVTTDRLSAFDRVVGAAPYKGQVLNQLSAWWFQKTVDIIPNHLIDLPDPNATLAQELTPYPIEVIVRGYITGVTQTALWRRYELGEREVYGYTLPEGLRKNQALPEPMITPTTKGSPTGHDERLTCAEVVSQGWVPAKTWEHIQAAALALFKKGQTLAKRAGLILVDTKYEFGQNPSGEVLLMDEIHTPDSSRFWELNTYSARLAAGQEPDNFDKEFIRLQLIKAGYQGQGIPPTLPEEIWLEASKRYITLYERLTGEAFQPGEYPVLPRLKRHLAATNLLI